MNFLQHLCGFPNNLVLLDIFHCCQAARSAPNQRYASSVKGKCPHLLFCLRGGAHRSLPPVHSNNCCVAVIWFGFCFHQSEFKNTHDTTPLHCSLNPIPFQQNAKHSHHHQIYTNIYIYTNNNHHQPRLASLARALLSPTYRQIEYTSTVPWLIKTHQHSNPNCAVSRACSFFVYVLPPSSHTICQPYIYMHIE